ncbi:hypothetical protein ACQR0Z_23630 [Bradyrhizobium sp. HKCCYLS3077]|uniref:hypothetical protein n=1 Tax=Bradyrhizobium sp. HKCCYLS3077 TaxID=3420761 RepID=UPI003EB70224
MRRWTVALSFWLLAFIPILSTKSVATEIVTPKGSRIGIELPAGFAASSSFTGFVAPAQKASIVMTEMPAGGLEQIRRGLSSGAMAQHGMRLLATEQIDKFPYDHLMARAEQPVGSEVYDKWLLFFDAKDFVGSVTVTVAKSPAAGLTDAAIRTALASVRIATAASVDPIAALPFSVQPTSRFKYRLPVSGRSLMLKESPPPPNGQIDDAVFITTLAGDAPVAPADQRQFGENQFLTSRAISDKSILSGKPVEVAGVAGFEFLGRGKQSGGQQRSYLIVVLYPGGRPVVMMGSALSERFDAIAPEFRTMVDSFRAKL